MTSLSRRAALGSLAGAAVVGGVCLAGGVAPQAQAAAQTFPWPYKKLDPKEVGEPAYWGYYNESKGCGYGAFASIVGTLADKYGAPYNTFPMDIMVVGKSGVAGWGTVCGSLLGAASAIALFHPRKAHTKLIDHLFRWYETSEVPHFAPAKAKLDFTPTPSVPTSVLCHVSGSKWSYETGIPMHDKRRSERCARVTAQVAMKAVEILNAAHDGTLPAFVGFSAEAESCKTCHGKGKESDHAKGKMDCMSCHSELAKDHP